MYVDSISVLLFKWLAQVVMNHAYNTEDEMRHYLRLLTVYIILESL